MKKVYLAIIFALNMVILIPTGYASDNVQPLLPATKAIPDLTSTLNKLKKATTLPVIFPQRVPQDHDLSRYYSHYVIDEPGQTTHYTLSIDATSDCQGIRACNLGYLSARADANPEIYYDMNNQAITIPVQLAKQLQGYFTPGHAIGSFFPAKLEWREGTILYTLTWTMAPAAEQATLIAMANSAIESN